MTAVTLPHVLFRAERLRRLIEEEQSTKRNALRLMRLKALLLRVQSRLGDALRGFEPAPRPVAVAVHTAVTARSIRRRMH